MSENAPPDEMSPAKTDHPLKQNIEDVAELELIGARVASRSSLAVWWARAIFLITVLVGMIPTYLVIQDRWFGKPISITAVDEFWWSMPALRGLAYPRYFLIIFGVTIFTALVVFFWRNGPRLVFPDLNIGDSDTSNRHVDEKQYRAGRHVFLTGLAIANISAVFVFMQGRIPGWELLLALAFYISGRILMEYSIVNIKEYFHERGRFLLEAALFVIALCSVLYALFGESKPNFIFFLLFVLAGINFLRHRKETPTIFWVGMAALAALTWKLDSWEYVVIGDEYSFYTEIRNILENRTVWELINNTFNGNLVYGTHPYFSSYIHNFFMKMFDNHNFGWRFSNPFLVACALFFFYYFFQAFVSRRTALVTVTLLGFSHYLLSFSKIGYNNLQALFALGLVLAIFTWALQSMSVTAFSLLGLAMGICFYLYPGALYVVPLPVLGLLMLMPPITRAAVKRWGWMIVSAGLLIYPLVSQPAYWAAKVAGTFLSAEISNSAATLTRNILLNVLYTSLSFLYTPEQTHYVSTGYMDPLSGVFIVMGFVCLMQLVFRWNRSALFLALSFLWIFSLVGLTHGRNFPPTTRMFLLLPWFAFYTALGLEWCAERAELLFNIDSRRLIQLFVSLIVMVNLYHAHVIDIRNTAQYHTMPAMFVKTVREINANSAMPPKSYAFVAPLNWDISGMAVIQRAYLVPDSPRQLINLPLDGNLLPLSAEPLVRQRDIVVIVKGDMDAKSMAQVDVQLQDWGKYMCEIRNIKGRLQFQLWHSGDLAWLCP
jgi:dolichyl-phosphate-mannose-protein mannosyltransferase